MESLENILIDHRLIGKKIILTGDINIDSLESSSAIINFISMMQSFHFISTINKPTRFPNREYDKHSLIDHIWLNFPIPCTTGIILDSITDHLPLFLRLHSIYRPSEPSFKKVSFRVFSDENDSDFSRELSNVDWCVLNGSGIDDQLKIFTDTINTIYGKCSPLLRKQISKRRKDNPWMTQQLLNLVKARSQFFHLRKLELVSVEENKQFRNRVTSILRKAKIDYYRRKFEQHNGNSKKTWQIIRDLTSGKNVINEITSIMHNDNEVTDKQEMCELFNNYFSTVGSVTHSDTANSDNPLRLITRNSSSMYLTPVSTTEVSNVIKKLKTIKQPLDHIPVKLWTKNSDKLALPLVTIINSSFNCGNFPNSLKSALVVPIYKKGKHNNLSNYRPISLLPLISKIFERCLYNRLVSFISKFNLLTTQQFGFQKKKCTLDAIVCLTEKIYQSLNQKNYNVNVFIDYRKAFDSVNHDISLRKLEAYGIRGVVLKLLTIYLRDRTQKVRINN